MIAERIRRIGTLVFLSAVLLIAAVQFTLSYAEVGITDEIWTQGLPAVTADFSGIPQAVVNDATRLSAELFGKSGEKYQRFVEQLLTNYEEAQGKDFILVFNPGGWGWRTPDKTQGWGSILDGIQTELGSLGYRSEVINYRRTNENLSGRAGEFLELLRAYPSKARDLANRLEFLTAHLPELKVIVAGESNGAAMSDSVMNVLRDNRQVYSIQTGTPFWHHTVVYDRTLVMNSNGTGPDAFSRGDFPAIIWSNLKNTFGFQDRAGTVLVHLKAPGHDYSWRYPAIYDQVTKFLEDNFGIKRS